MTTEYGNKGAAGVEGKVTNIGNSYARVVNSEDRGQAKVQCMEMGNDSIE